MQWFGESHDLNNFGKNDKMKVLLVMARKGACLVLLSLIACRIKKRKKLMNKKNW